MLYRSPYYLPSMQSVPADDSGHRRSRVCPEHAEAPYRGRNQHRASVNQPNMTSCFE